MHFDVNAVKAVAESHELNVILKQPNLDLTIDSLGAVCNSIVRMLGVAVS